MNIPFPRMHIAASALNRISNALEEKGPLGLSNKKPQPNIVEQPPIVPDPSFSGMVIDARVQQPLAPVEAPPGTQADMNSGMVTNSLTGGSPFNGGLVGAGF